MLEYIMFMELAHFPNNYMATDMEKVWKFEDGKKLSIRGKIMGLILQNLDSMVRIALDIEREVEDA